MPPGGDGGVIRRLAVVGLGLLGGSVAKAARSRRLAGEIVAIGRRRDALEPALAEGVVDRATTDLDEGLDGADFVLLATPVAAMERQLPEVWRSVADDAVVTDVGSTKGRLVRAALSLSQARGVAFVGSHPMAGSELSGYASSRADLFESATVILTPVPETPGWVSKRVAEFWEAQGARVVTMPPEAHDRVVAAVSHLPHLVACALVDAVAGLVDEEGLEYAAGGFRDTTRIAASDPRVWREIFLANREALLEALGGFRSALSRLERLLTPEAGESLERELEKIRLVRRRLQ
jgi:prephenate dehydrogenase